jgi:hypothetical protein
MKGSWSVKLEDGPHTIRADDSRWTMQLKVYFDNYLMDTKTVFMLLGDVYQFERNGHHFVIGVKGLSYLGGHFTLTIDGYEVNQGGMIAPPPPAPPPQRQVMPTPSQFLQEVNVVETSEVYRTEEYPFDNRFGDSELSTEREISEESTNEFSLETTNQINGKLSLEAFSFLKAEIAGQVSRKVGHNIGEKMTESQTLHLRVRANSSVVYRIIWKRKIRSGEYVYLVNGNQVSIPYRMKYGLSVEVQTRQLDKAE